MSNFMTLEVALGIVYCLANDNALTDVEVAKDPVLEDIYNKQQLALITVHDFIANHCGEEYDEEE